MTSYVDVFKRKEMKYVLSGEQRQILETSIIEHLVLGEFSDSKVLSLYYDTPDFALIERSLDKPFYKEKLRLRVYGEPSVLAPAFVEVKKKYEGVVYKRRVALSLRGAQAFLGGSTYEKACRAFPLLDRESQALSLSPHTLQIAREIEFMMQRHGTLEPSILTACERRAYIDPAGGELRITFDGQLSCAYNARSVFDAHDMVPLLYPTQSIMEVKNAGPLPFWLVQALNAAKAYPQSFSKYGHAYMNLRKDDKSA